MALAWAEVDPEQHPELSAELPLTEREALAVVVVGIDFLRQRADVPQTPVLLADGAPGIGDLLMMKMGHTPAA